MQQKYVPNIIPLSTRLFCGVLVVLLAFYMLGELMTGYTFVPGRRGGILLSGVPTLMIVAASALICLSLMLTIIDHYDKRPNEEVYVATRKRCGRIALGLFIAAFFFELAEYPLRQAGLSPFPEFHGVAARYSLYSEKFNNYLPYLKKYSPITILIAIIGVVIALAVRLLKSFIQPRWAIILFSLSILLLIPAFMGICLSEFLEGAVYTGGSRGSYYSAISEPAKFNAIILANLMVILMMFVGAAFLLIRAVANRFTSAELEQFRNRL